MTSEAIKTLRDQAAAEGNMGLVALCNAARMLGTKSLLDAVRAELAARSR